LVSQTETGKISCVRLPHCGRLPPGACNEEMRGEGPRFLLFQAAPQYHASRLTPFVSGVAMIA
jgi:hypothetical protein